MPEVVDDPDSPEMKCAQVCYETFNRTIGTRTIMPFNLLPRKERDAWRQASASRGTNWVDPCDHSERKKAYPHRSPPGPDQCTKCFLIFVDGTWRFAN